MWFGSDVLHARLLRRLVAYGSGFNPLGRPSDADIDRLRQALELAGRRMDEVEMVGGTRGRFPDPDAVADLDEALASIPEQVRRGFRTICIKPSQFVDDPAEIEEFCRTAVAQVGRLTG